MDDSCAVCAETLEWVAYGACGHREVCSTCVIRLRFICTDYHCCLCKSFSNIIFVTKALGDYPRMINDFSVFPVNPTEGQVGSYWYHEGTQAYFDDIIHYKAIKAMCRLSCGVCDKVNEQKNKGTKRTAEFKNIQQLENHLLHRHRLFMCSLCLEGRKIFICEQKLYNKAQLNQHLKTGDSVIDGNERERGGFMGHPMCEFCQNPFYGENELYSHMSREHYTCHICERLHTGKYEYYKDYDDLEIHFRQEHFLCENEACLANKFVVFATDSEMKSHIAAEHRGCAYLSRCNAVPQIPTSFRHHQSNGNDGQGREHGYYHDSLVNQRHWAIQPSFRTVIEQHISNASSNVRRFHKVKASDNESDVNSFDILATLKSGSSLGCNHALDQTSRNGVLEESSFPPLPSASRSSQHKFKNWSEEMSENTMAAGLCRQNNRTYSCLSSQDWRTTIYQPASSSSSSHQSSLATDPGSLSFSGSPCSSRSKSATVNGCISSGPSASSQAMLTADVKIMPVDMASALRNFSEKGHLSNDGGHSKKQKNSKKGKEKCGEDGINFALIDNSISGLSNLQLKCNPSDKEVNVLAENGYPSAKGKSKVSVDEVETGNSSSARPSRMEQRNKNVSQSTGAGSKQSIGTGAGGNKQQKKMPKFLRNRLGNDVAAFSDLDDSDPGHSHVQERSAGYKEPSGQLPVRGVWRNGGGRRLVAMTQGKLTK